MRRNIVGLQSIAVIAALGAACGENARVPSSQPQTSAASSPAPPMADAAVSLALRSEAARAGVRPLAQVVDAPGASPPQDASSSATPNMVIRNGTASVQVDSLELGIAAVQNMATTFGGYVGNTSLAAGDNQVRSATIELKIPSARYEEALAGMRVLGKVEAVSSTAQDVGEEFVDVTARATNAKRLEERLVALLATRTGKLEDVLAVERELARVREEIERAEGRIRYLKSRVAMSTLSVTVHEKAPLVSAVPGENVIVDAFKNAWRNFVRFIAMLISSLGVVIPLAVIGVAGWILRKRFVRPR